MFVSFLTLLSSSMLLTECAITTRALTVVALYGRWIHLTLFECRLASFSIILSFSFKLFALVNHCFLFRFCTLHIFTISTKASLLAHTLTHTHTCMHIKQICHIIVEKTHTFRSNPNKYSVKYTRISSKQRNKWAKCTHVIAWNAFI